MSKVLKWLAFILGVLILLVVGITLLIRFYLSGELITAWITPPLEHYLQRDVRLADAKIGLRGFRAEGLEIRKESAGAPLLKGEELELRWKLKELFKGRIVIHTLAFSKPEITLVRNEDGSFNIADLLPQKGASEPAVFFGNRSKSQPSGVALRISLLTMADGLLTLVDRSRQPHVTMQISNIRARINDLSSFTPVHFALEGQIEGQDKGSCRIKGNFDLAKGTITGDLSFQGLALALLNPFFAKETPNVIQQGTLTLEASLKAEEYDHIKGVGRLKLADLQIRRNEGLTKALELEADFRLDTVISQQTLSIDALNVVLNGQKAKIEGLFTQWYQRPQFNFILNSPQLKLDELLALASNNSPPSGTTGTEVEQLTLQGESAAENPEVETGAESPPASSSDVPVTQAEKMGEEPETAAEPATTTDQATESALEQVATATGTEPGLQSIPIGPKPKPIPLDAQGEIHLDWLFYNKLVVSNVDCQVRLLDGKLQVEPVSASIYGGGLTGGVRADLESPGPPFHYRVFTKNVLLDEVIGAFWPKARGSWSGNMNQISSASVAGSDLTAIKVHTDLNINEAEFSNHPLLLKLAELFQTEDLQQVQFSQVTARVLIKQTVANINRLHMIGPILQVEGSGTAGLLDRKLDLRLHLQIRTQYVGKLASLRDIVPKISEEQGFVQLPLNVSGTFDEPVYRLDEHWLAELTEEAAEEPAKKLEQEVLPTASPSAPEDDKHQEEPRKPLQ
jgi:uncharacterized protein involved in outer membrane biogenesis